LGSCDRGGATTEIFEMKKRKCFFIIMQVSSSLADRKAS